ncbi:hypothetical protein B1F79_01000 [Coxiella-like endosymbiont of Rhipicephalus sanguineus]|nr:hypothetical protein [Coxiella-like endosymbiont of Rhipicephalus sanguineus]
MGKNAFLKFDSNTLKVVSIIKNQILYLKYENNPNQAGKIEEKFRSALKKYRAFEDHYDDSLSRTSLCSPPAPSMQNSFFH